MKCRESSNPRSVEFETQTSKQKKRFSLAICEMFQILSRTAILKPKAEDRGIFQTLDVLREYLAYVQKKPETQKTCVKELGTF